MTIRLNDILTEKQIRVFPVHVKEILKYCISLDLKDIEFHHNCHFKVTWLANGKRCGITFSGTPRNYENMLKIVKRDIKRSIARYG